MRRVSTCKGVSRRARCSAWNPSPWSVSPRSETHHSIRMKTLRPLWPLRLASRRTTDGPRLGVDGTPMPAHEGLWCAFYPDVPSESGGADTATNATHAECACPCSVVHGVKNVAFFSLRKPGNYTGNEAQKDSITATHDPSACANR